MKFSTIKKILPPMLAAGLTLVILGSAMSASWGDEDFRSLWQNKACMTDADSDGVRGIKPRARGPLHLKKIYCVNGYGLISPDGKKRAFIWKDDDYLKNVTTSRVGDDLFIRQGPYDAFDFPTPFRHSNFIWSSDSKKLWVATQKHMRPAGGWAVEGFRFYKAENGRFEYETSLPKSAGYLDSVIWVEPGIAIGAFNMKGSWYRPEHEDTDPYYALVNAWAGLVQHKLSPAELLTKAIEFERERGLIAPGDVSPKEFVFLTSVSSSAENPLRVVFLMQKVWAIWIPGQSLNFSPRKADRLGELGLNAAGGALSPNGKTFLSLRGLQAIRHCPIVEHWSPGMTSCTIPDTPVEGVLAELHDVDAGKILWRIRARAENNWRGAPPAISPDGRFALVSYPPEKGDWRTPSRVALVSMANGKILQMLGFDRPHTFGFVKDGKLAYIQGDAYSVFYKVSGGDR